MHWQAPRSHCVCAIVALNVMGLCCLSEKRDDEIINTRINSEIRRRRRRDRREMKLLLLGAGESGKSTFLKQMRIIHGNGYSDAEKRKFIHLIYRNILNSLRDLITAMSTLQVQYSNAENVQIAYGLLKTDASEVHTHQQFLCHTEQIQSLWKDAGVQRCYERRQEYQLSDSTSYYLNRLDAVKSADFIPTEQDILRVRVPTTGIVEYNFSVKTVPFRMIDVGGQRSERRKWIHCFEAVASVLFLVALSGYDQTLTESEQCNRMEESIALFKTIANYQLFRRIPFILFFNKTDLFEDKIMVSNLSDYFPEYSGPEKNSAAARRFIRKKFTDLSNGSERNTYSHFTCATDTENIRAVFEDVKDSIVQCNLDQCLI